MSLFYNTGKLVGRFVAKSLSGAASLLGHNVIKAAFIDALLDSMRIGGIFLLVFGLILGLSGDLILTSLYFFVGGFIFWFAIYCFRYSAESF